MSNAEFSHRLILGRLPADADPVRDMPLGAWCFVGAEDVWPDWESRPFADAYDTVEEYCTAADQVCGLVEIKLLELAETLNRRHGVDYSPNWWRIVLMPWLHVVLEGMWVRYVHLRRAIVALSDEAVLVEVAEVDALPCFKGTMDYFDRGISGPDFNIWLLSLMLTTMAPPNWTLRPVPLTMPNPKSKPLPTAVPSGRLAKLRRSVHQFASWLGVDDVIGLRFSKVALGAALTLVPRRRIAEPVFTRRFPCNLDYFGPDFLALVDQIIAKTMPLSFTDDFRGYEQQALRVRAVPGRLRIGTLSQWDEQARFDAAMRSRAGERLIQVQHGGAYGTSRRLPMTRNFETTFEAFISWGWRETAACPGDVIALPAPFLSGFANRHRARDNTLVLVGTIARPYRYHLQSAPMPGQWVNYRREKTAFLATLSPRLRDSLRYRQYPGSSSALADGVHYQARFPFLTLLEQPLHKSMLRCRLLVLDHPGTTLNIAMAANVPTLMFWEREAWPKADEARPLFDAMERCGMLVYSGREAAERAEALWDNVENWWQSAEVQAARLAYCREFARYDRAWLAKWIRVLAARSR